MYPLPLILFCQPIEGPNLATWLALLEATRPAEGHGWWWQHGFTLIGNAVLALLAILALVWRTQRMIRSQADNLQKQLEAQAEVLDSQMRHQTEEATRDRHRTEAHDRAQDLRQRYAQWRVAGHALLLAGRSRDPLRELLQDFDAQEQLLTMSEDNNVGLRLIDAASFAVREGSADPSKTIEQREVRQHPRLNALNGMVGGWRKNASAVGLQPQLMLELGFEALAAACGQCKARLLDAS